MLLKELKYPGCGAPLKSKERDLMLTCSHCGRISLYADGKVGDVAYTIAAPTKESPGELVYVPFWIVNADLNVKKETISGGKISRFVTDKKNRCGVPATSMSVPQQFLRSSAGNGTWTLHLTSPD